MRNSFGYTGWVHYIEGGHFEGECGTHCVIVERFLQNDVGSGSDRVSRDCGGDYATVDSARGQYESDPRGPVQFTAFVFHCDLQELKMFFEFRIYGISRTLENKNATLVSEFQTQKLFSKFLKRDKKTFRADKETLNCIILENFKQFAFLVYIFRIFHTI